MNQFTHSFGAALLVFVMALFTEVFWVVWSDSVFWRRRFRAALTSGLLVLMGLATTWLVIETSLVMVLAAACGAACGAYMGLQPPNKRGK